MDKLYEINTWISGYFGQDGGFDLNLSYCWIYFKVFGFQISTLFQKSMVESYCKLNGKMIINHWTFGTFFLQQGHAQKWQG